MAKTPVISSLTTLPPSPTDDRKRRMTNYLIAMAIRIGCILMCFVVQGWWALIFVIGAVVIPYFAVVLANVSSGQGAVVRRPGAVVPVRQSGPFGSSPFESSPSDSYPFAASDAGYRPPAPASPDAPSTASYAKQPPARKE